MEIIKRSHRQVVYAPSPYWRATPRTGAAVGFGRSKARNGPLKPVGAGVKTQAPRLTPCLPPPRAKGRHRPPSTGAVLEPKWLRPSLSLSLSLSLSFFRQGYGQKDCSPCPRASAPPTVVGRVINSTCNQWNCKYRQKAHCRLTVIQTKDNAESLGQTLATRAAAMHVQASATGRKVQKQQKRSAGNKGRSLPWAYHEKKLGTRLVASNCKQRA